VVLFVFLCVVERRTPYLMPITLIPSISVSVLMSHNTRKTKYKKTPKCMLKNFEKASMEIRESS
jgi:hypothetical protein